MLRKMAMLGLLTVCLSAPGLAIEPPSLDPPRIEPPTIDPPRVEAPHMSASDVAEMSMTRTPGGTLTPAPSITPDAHTTVHPHRGPSTE